MTELTLMSPAKLNLMLHITGRRQDGYHELQTLFQILDYGDRMHFRVTDDDEIHLNCPGLDLPAADNLIFRAATLLREHCSLTRGCAIRLDKILPMGGGLGGGSSNAATTLVALNHLWQAGCSREELCRLGVSLGADVPVFVGARSAWAEGIGEHLTPVELPDRWFVVIHPGVHVCTRTIFQHPDLTRSTPLITIRTALAGGGNNDCETIVRQLYPEVDTVFRLLAEHAEPRLTGTGACVFTECSDQAEAEAILQQMQNRFHGFIARSLNQSPLYRL